MTRDVLEKELKAFGNFVHVYADSDHVVYLPKRIAEQVSTKLNLQAIPEDTFFNSYRHQNNGTALLAYRY